MRLLRSVVLLFCAVTISGAAVFTGESLNVPFTVHGRLRNYMGDAQMRIWIVGSTRMLGVDGVTPESDKVAALFPDGGQFAYSVFADFTVEPLASDIKGSKRPVRLLQARNIVVERDSDGAIVLRRKQL